MLDRFAPLRWLLASELQTLQNLYYQQHIGFRGVGSARASSRSLRPTNQKVGRRTRWVRRVPSGRARHIVCPARVPTSL